MSKKIRASEYERAQEKWEEYRNDLLQDMVLAEELLKYEIPSDFTVLRGQLLERAVETALEMIRLSDTLRAAEQYNEAKFDEMKVRLPVNTADAELVSQRLVDYGKEEWELMGLDAEDEVFTFRRPSKPLK